MILTCLASCFAIGIQCVIWHNITPINRESKHVLASQLCETLTTVVYCRSYRSEKKGRETRVEALTLRMVRLVLRPSY